MEVALRQQTTNPRGSQHAEPEGMRCDDNAAAIAVFVERHYTVEEIAELWQLSKDAIRRLFRNEPGVLVLSGPISRVRKRPYKTIRIPESVVRRVHKRRSLI